MAPKRIYTRRNPDQNPPKVVENPNRILRRSNNRVVKGIFHLPKSLSLPAKTVENIILDKKFEKALLKSKYASELSKIIVGPEELDFLGLLSTLLSSHPPLFSLKTKLPKVHIHL